MVGLEALVAAPADPVVLAVVPADPEALEAAPVDPVVLVEDTADPSVGPEDRVDTVALALMSPTRLCIIGDRFLMGCSFTSLSWPKCIVLGIFCVSWIWEDRFLLRSWISSLPCLAVPSTPE
jgi:hypothetical protein